MRGKNKGKIRSPETRAKISAALKGRKPSLETRAKMSAAHKAGWAKMRAVLDEQAPRQRPTPANLADSRASQILRGEMGGRRRAFNHFVKPGEPTALELLMKDDEEDRPRPTGE
jgi:hypothetical protein